MINERFNYKKILYYTNGYYKILNDSQQILEEKNYKLVSFMYLFMPLPPIIPSLPL